MQKVFNVLSAVSFVGFAAIAGGIGYVYVQKDAIIENAKEQAIEELTEALPELLSGALGGGIGDSLPSGGLGGAGASSGSFAPPNVPGLGF